MIRKFILLLFIALLIVPAFTACDDSGDSDSFNGALEITITDTSGVVGTFIIPIFDYPNFTPASTDILNSTSELFIHSDGSQDTLLLTIHNLKSDTVYFSVLVDSNNDLTPTEGEMCIIYNNIEYSSGESATPVTLTNGGTTQISISYEDFVAYSAK